MAKSSQLKELFLKQNKAGHHGFAQHSEQKFRLINKDGTYNVGNGKDGPMSKGLYHMLLYISWPKFFLLVLATYIIINSLYAILYLILGLEQISHIDPGPWWQQFLYAFFFSTQTFTTVGFGNMSPIGITGNILASIESMTGLMGFALASSILYGRFARPTAHIQYSQNAVISPYRDGSGFKFRIANKRNHILVEMNASVMLSILIDIDGIPKRRFYELKLEYSRVKYFPLDWTIIHSITPESPLYGMKAADLEEKDVEFLVLVKGYDDTFAQFVYDQSSYKWYEINWNAQFLPMFYYADTGKIVLEIDKVDDMVNLPEH